MGLEPYQLMDFCKKFDYIFEEKPCDIVNPTKIDSHLIDVKFGDYYFANAMMTRYQMTGEKKFVRQALKTLGQKKHLPFKNKSSDDMDVVVRSPILSPRSLPSRLS